RKQAEEERERVLVLEQEARSKAERASAARDELLSIVAHDLRNPFHVITTAAGKLGQSPSEKKRDEYIKFIQQSAGEMNRLIDDLLDVSLMEGGRFAVRRKPVDLRAVLEEACDLFELPAREANITLEWQMDAIAEPVKADRSRLLQL